MYQRLFLLLTACAVSPFALAADPVRAPVYTPPPASAVSAGSFLQMIFSLLLVLAAVVAVAWVLKRLNAPQLGNASVLKVISGVAVGQRERIVLVEVSDTWLVVGVAPGQVRTLHTLPKNTLPPVDTPSGEAADTKFKQWLKLVMEKRNAG